MRTLRAGYTYDESLKRRVNAAGSNYWWAYIEEILERLGLCADRIGFESLSCRLSDCSLLFLGGGDSMPVADELARWVESGGVLIACNQDCLDDLCGNRFAEFVPQRGGEFSIGGEFTLRQTEFSAGIHAPLHPDAPLLAASALRLVDPVDSLAVAESGGHALVTARKVGAGWAFYIGFDIAQTFWVIQQGRPVDCDHDGDGYWRTADAIVTAEYEPEIAYTDELLLLLQNIVSVQPLPLVHRLPPLDDRIPDALFYYNGDDEGLVGDQLPAAHFMAEHGLPYHMNCMAKCGRFGIGPDEIAELDRLGTELSVHYDFMDGFDHPGGFKRDDVARQTREFAEHFGRCPIASVNHWCRWTGWAEPAAWMSDAGVSADGSFIGVQFLSNNPTNNLGFLFGTSYPFHFWTDHTEGNRRLDFLELPCAAYEIGYSGDNIDTAKLQLALNAAVHYQSAMVFFYHPIYIARYPACREAIVRLLAMIEERGLVIAHSAPDAVTRWWNARTDIRITDVETDSMRVRFKASAPSGVVFIASVPLGSRRSARTDRPHQIVEKFGRRWLYAVIDGGESVVEIEFD